MKLNQFIIFIIFTVLGIGCSIKLDQQTPSIESAKKLALKKNINEHAHGKPNLKLDATLVDPVENRETKLIVAGGSNVLTVSLKNLGDKSVDGIKIDILNSNQLCIITPAYMELGKILPRDFIDSDFSVCFGDFDKDNELILKISIREPDGGLVCEMDKTISVKGAYVALVGTTEIMDTSGNGLIEQNEEAELFVHVRNTGGVAAKDVNVSIENMKQSAVRVSPLVNYLEKVLPGETKSVSFKVLINDINVSGGSHPLNIILTDGDKLDPVYLTVNLPLGLSDDKALFAEIMKSPCIKLCRQYIQRHPYGEDVGEVKNTLEKLEWETAKQINTIAALEEFKRSYPKGRFVQEADKNINRIAANLERGSWEKALEQRTEASMLEYLENNPNGNHKDEANSILAELKALENVKDTNTYKAYKKFLDDYPQYKNDKELAVKATFAYWKNQLKNNPENAHLLCQIADGMIDEKGQFAYDEAYKHYKEAIDLDENSIQAYTGVCYIDLNKKNYERVITNATNAIKKKQETGLLFFYLGKAYDALDEKDKRNAIKYYEKCILKRSELDKKTYIECLYNCALCYRSNLNMREAVKKFILVLENDPNSTYAKSAKQYID